MTLKLIRLNGRQSPPVDVELRVNNLFGNNTYLNLTTSDGLRCQIEGSRATWQQLLAELSAPEQDRETHV